LDDIAQQIVNLTRVLTDADQVQAGKPVHIDVLPGFSTALPSVTTLKNVTLSGTITGGITGTLATLVEPIQFSVRFVVRKDVDDSGQGGVGADKGPGNDFIATPDIGVVATDPLNVAFLLKPPVGEDIVFNSPTKYAIDIIISVSVEGLTAAKTITVPIDMPAIPIPALLLLGKHSNFRIYDGDDAGSLFVMVKASSPLRDLGAVVATLNRITGIAETLRSFLLFGGLFIKALEDAAAIISIAPTVYFSIGNASVLDDNGLDFEGVASSLLLIGLHDGSAAPSADSDGNVPTVLGITQVTLYNDEGFDKGGIDEEHSTFTVSEQVFGNVHTGVGFLRIDSFNNMSWATDPGDDLDNGTSSVRWGGVP
jgi:hypothetical protein